MAEGQARVGAEGVADPPLSTGVRGHKKLKTIHKKEHYVLSFSFLSFFLIWGGTRSLRIIVCQR